MSEVEKRQFCPGVEFDPFASETKSLHFAIRCGQQSWCHEMAAVAEGATFNGYNGNILDAPPPRAAKNPFKKPNPCLVTHPPTVAVTPYIDANISLGFLKALRPHGPWALTAIVPDGKTTTRSFAANDEAGVRKFIERCNRTMNIYFTGNLCGAPSKKPTKADMQGAIFLHTDDDPRTGETQEAARARILAAYEAHTMKPSIVINSGNGLQGLWLLDEDHQFPKLINPQDDDEIQTRVAEIEDRNRALAAALGTTPGTHNVDRLLRLPGTINYPNRKKREKGYIACRANIVWIDNTRRYPLTQFPKLQTTEQKPKKTRAVPVAIDELDDIISNGCGDRYDGDRSKAVWFVINEMLRRGYLSAAIVQVLTDKGNGISEHVYDQEKPRTYAERQVAKAMQEINFKRNEDGKIFTSLPDNIRIGMLKLGVTVRYDQFGERVLVDGLSGFGPVLEDAAVNRIWLLFDQRFHFRPQQDLMHVVLQDMARLNEFHPVRDYLNGLQWDGVPRIDNWLTTYAKAADNKYTRAVSAITLIAAVRRVRQPGVKFDEMLVLEQSRQGTDKSSALATLAVHDDWFSDDLPLNVESKRVIEALRGHWIIEAAELSGLKKADVEHLKASLSRRIDRARMAWGRLPIEAPRQCIIIGTTNKREYLRDTTGNRRFWPVLVQAFDLKALRRDRDQLWAEAAERETKGESIRLAPDLWPTAAEAQQQRLADDPFVEVLRDHIGHLKGKIKAVAVWEILNLHGAQLTQDVFARASEAMKRIGWKRPNKAGMARFDGKLMTAFVRGKLPRKEIIVTRGTQGLKIRLER